ncbi:DUF4245 family protein [Microbacterium karelineae]|uniref:DUF4245 family protein n=1 Tax=Microbacterium karelineae TaxID=2654283 RepID=UPI0012EA3D38|nr:DUF4245 family protein [Microbacterium karelineae]
MARAPRVVAHLGRPETAEETAARKAENSRRYRQSQSFRNLIIALVVSLAVVAVVYFVVPRGDLAEPAQPDVGGIAAQASEQFDRTVIVPDAPDGWGVNLAEIDAGTPAVWTVNFNDIPDAARSFLRFAQAFDADDAWAAQTLRGAAPTGAVTIDGVEWDEYEIGDPDSAGNVSYALGAQAGPDHVLIYGAAEADTAAIIASAVADDIATLQKEDTP